MHIFNLLSTEAGKWGCSPTFSKALLLGSMLSDRACLLAHGKAVVCEYILWKAGAALAEKRGQPQMVHFLFTMCWEIATLLPEGEKYYLIGQRKKNRPQGWSITIPTFLSVDKLIGRSNID